MNKETCLLLGTITKANRKTGQLTISIGQQPAERFAEVRTLFLDIDGGLVPFFVDQQSGSGSGQLRVWLQDYKTPRQRNSSPDTKFTSLRMICQLPRPTSFIIISSPIIL